MAVVLYLLLQFLRLLLYPELDLVRLLNLCFLLQQLLLKGAKFHSVLLDLGAHDGAVLAFYVNLGAHVGSVDMRGPPSLLLTLHLLALLLHLLNLPHNPCLVLNLPVELILKVLDIPFFFGDYVPVQKLIDFLLDHLVEIGLVRLGTAV